MKERRHILEDGREVTIREAAGGEATELLA